MSIELTDEAILDSAELPKETFYSKEDTTEKNLSIGADPEQAFDKFFSLTFPNSQTRKTRFNKNIDRGIENLEN